ncbi:MAG: ATP-binding protein [Hyphomicrobiales bacterium]|nr:ATP-binding protein [Hyphomicrobiales bacterium]
MVRLGLTTRLFAIGATFLLTIWLGLVALYYRSNGLDRSLTRPPVTQLRAIADVLSATKPGDRDALLDAIASSILSATIETERALTTSDGDGREVGDDLRGTSEFVEYDALLDGRLLSIVRLGRPEPIVGPASLFASAIGTLRFRLRLDDGAILRLDTRTPFVVTLFGLPAGMGAGLVGTVFALIAFLLLNREIRPLTRLAAAVDRIDPSSAPIALPVVGAHAPETLALHNAFDRLQTRLQTLIAGRFALIGGVQHDVRSFATRLRLRVEHIGDPAERDKAAADIDDMIGLLDNALLTARAGVGRLDEELLDLSTLLRQEVIDLGAGGRPVRLGTMPPASQEVPVILDRTAFRRIVVNLVDNAVKYGREARVELEARQGRALVSVSDAGAGIAPEAAAVLFEPFVRGEPSRSRRTGGAGLGLAVVRSLAEAQEGTVEIGRAEGGGARVELSFPLFVA